ncbi:nucleoside triphosphate pyrophosphohydrolase family protein [Psychrobacter namhaensis]|uniref:nucleoside triphosphate pyrophosphohydrolase family protein n=1 Tax=Psychrobacter namhaensis TaxID=292734 RepID=UPI001D12B6E3|nr:nucleoside triphosphate pyrophosphohydrolase family protein [Psychrobacter namhaensis]
MNNLPLKPLFWKDYGNGTASETRSALHEYDAWQTDNDTGWYVGYFDRRNPTGIKEATGFATIDEAKQWAWNHYNEKMQPYVKPDSITDIRNWFKAAKPEPTDKDVCTQIGCHYEEVYEMDVALYGYEPSHNGEIADWYKGDSISVVNVIQRMDKVELLDALCDQIVTATGVAYMMGFDIEGALKEVIRSNNSKMVKGKFEYDENGKIMKPESYSEPDLTPFLKQGE